MNDFETSERSTLYLCNFKIASTFTFNFLPITIPVITNITNTTTVSIHKKLILSLTVKRLGLYPNLGTVQVFLLSMIELTSYVLIL